MICATSVHLDCVSTNNTINTSIVLVDVVCATSVHLDCVSIMLLILLLLPARASEQGNVIGLVSVFVCT